MSPFIRVQQAEMVFTSRKGRFHALREIDLDIAKGEFVTLIGHSGCGKSTLLNLIAGLLRPTDGGLLCDGREIAGPGPERAVVFQNHSLLPWLTCFDNVLLAVESVFGGRELRSRLMARTEEALHLVGMDHAMFKRPHEISGGMKQRVGIARALVSEPDILLADEPFAAIDAMTREAMQSELERFVAKTGQTVVFITHSIDEAVILGDRIAVISYRPGQIKEVVDVNLPRPRFDYDVKVLPEYSELRDYIWQLVKEEALQTTRGKER